MGSKQLFTEFSKNKEKSKQIGWFFVVIYSDFSLQDIFKEIVELTFSAHSNGREKIYQQIHKFFQNF